MPASPRTDAARRRKPGPDRDGRPGGHDAAVSRGCGPHPGDRGAPPRRDGGCQEHCGARAHSQVREGAVNFELRAGEGIADQAAGRWETVAEDAKLVPGAGSLPVLHALQHPRVRRGAGGVRLFWTCGIPERDLCLPCRRRESEARTSRSIWKTSGRSAEFASPVRRRGVPTRHTARETRIGPVRVGAAGPGTSAGSLLSSAAERLPVPPPLRASRGDAGHPIRMHGSQPASAMGWRGVTAVSKKKESMLWTVSMKSSRLTGLVTYALACWR